MKIGERRVAVLETRLDHGRARMDVILYQFLFLVFCYQSCRAIR